MNPNTSLLKYANSKVYNHQNTNIRISSKQRSMNCFSLKTLVLYITAWKKKRVKKRLKSILKMISLKQLAFYIWIFKILCIDIELKSDIEKIINGMVGTTITSRCITSMCWYLISASVVLEKIGSNFWSYNIHNVGLEQEYCWQEEWCLLL